MLINLRPLRYREYRLLLIGQTVSYLGSMITYVALPWQVYELTHSTFLVGLLGAVELVPILIFALIGGSVADSFDRRRLLVVSEALLSLGTIALSVNAYLNRPSLVAIFVIAAIMQSLNGFHRPAMDAMVQKLVPPEDYSSVGAIGNLRSSVGAIVGPALGGIIIAAGGVKSAYLFDFVTFLMALVAVFLMKPVPFVRNKVASHSAKILEGLKYAASRPELIGTYVVDIVAMTFAFPIALFPAIGEQWGGPKVAGLLFSSMAVGRRGGHRERNLPPSDLERDHPQ